MKQPLKNIWTGWPYSWVDNKQKQNMYLPFSIVMIITGRWFETAVAGGNHQYILAFLISPTENGHLRFPQSDTPTCESLGFFGFLLTVAFRRFDSANLT